jgi:predicted ATPase
LRFEWKDRYNDTIRDAGSMSEGTLRFIALTTLLKCRRQPLMTIDEPELGLHHGAIPLLAGLLESASKSQQVIIATQPNYLINYFPIEDIMTVDIIRGESLFRRLDTKKVQYWLDNGYVLDSIWRGNIIDEGQVTNIFYETYPQYLRR